ncbi:type II secretion system protein GspM [Porticoccus sp. GXU_MW_L64]
MNSTNLRERYQQLDDRDQLALKILAVFFGVLILVYGLAMPAYHYYQDGKDRVVEQQALLQWVEQHAPQVRQLAAAPKKTSTDKPIMESTTSAAKSVQVAINRLQPEGESLRAWMTQVPFEKAIQLFSLLEEQYQIHIQHITIEKTSKPGLVNIQCVLQKS